METKKGGLKKLKARFEAVKKQIDRVKKDGADVNLAISLLGEADGYLKGGDETESARILDNIDIIIKQAKVKKKYEMMIFNSLPMIEKAKRAGANVDASEAFLTKAKELLDMGEFGDAHEQIKMARREADNAKHFMTAKAQIQRVTPLVEAAKKRGVNVRDATNVILEAWEALRGGNYDMVADLVKKTATYLNIAEEQKNYEISIKDMEARISAVAESGVDVKEMGALLGEAKLALEQENYGDVRTLVNKIRREIEKIILRREAGLTVRTIQQFVRETKRAGIKSDELEDMLEKASVAMKSGDFSQVRSIELSAKQAVKNLKLFDTLSAGEIGMVDKEREEGFITLIGEELADSKRVVERARAGGIDVSEIDARIKSAEDALGAGHFDRAFEFVRQLRKLIQDDNSGFQNVEAKKKLEDINIVIEEARAIGIDMSEIEALITQARGLADGGHTGEAAELAIKASAALEEAITKGNAGRHPRLKVRIHSDGFEAQKWSRASVELSNIGNSIAKNIDVGFFGDVEVKDWQTIPKLLPGHNDRREIALKSFKPGKQPLDITVNYERSFDDTKFQLNDMKEVDVAEPGAFLVEDAFLIHNNGLLISKHTRRIREEVDGDLFSAMLTAISQFAKESFNLEEKVALNRLEFGDSQVLIERGAAFFVSVTLRGEESAYMPFFVSEIVREIEEKYGEILESWNGDVKSLEGIDEIVKKLLLIKNTESGIPDFQDSALHPALQAMRNGTAIPDLEKKMKELLVSFEEEMISGEMAESDELVDRIKETVGGELQSPDAAGEEEKRKDNMLRESIRHEIEVVRRQMAKAADTGADISKEEAMLADSLTMLERREYEKARGMLIEIEGLLRNMEMSMSTEAFAKRLEELKSALAVASKMGIDVSDVEGMLRETEKGVADGHETNSDAAFIKITDALGQKTGEFMADRHPKLHVEVDAGGAHEAGKWSRMDVVVSNRGNTPARNIDLNFSGDIEVKDAEPVDIVESNSSRKTELSVKPGRSGMLQMEVSASYQRYFDDTKYQLNDMKGLDVQMPGSYLVEDAFLIHNTGLLIARETRRIKEEVDSDLFSAMLKALTDFVRQAFNISKKGGLDRMEFGGKKLLIEKGKFVFLAITISGEESKYLPFFMAELVGDIENRYGATLEDWNGEMKPLAGIGEMIQKIIFVKQTGEGKIPIFKPSILAPVLEMASGDGVGAPQLADIEDKVARIADVIEENGLEAAQNYLAEMVEMVKGVVSAPSSGKAEAGGVDADSLKKRMYEIMVGDGHIDKDSALMDARLNNYMEVVGRMSDAVAELREGNGIPAEQTLASVVIKHPDYERWSEVLGNMRTLILEQVNAKDVRILRTHDIWDGLLAAVNIDEEHIRKSYKHIAKKIISVLRYMPPDKLLANIQRGTFTIGVEGQQVYITDEMVSIDFSLPPSAFEGTIDSGTIYIERMKAEEAKADTAANMLIGKIMAMREELEIEEGAKIEVQILASDALVENLERAKDSIMGKCGAHDVLFPLDDPFASGEYYVGELELEGETCKIGIVQVEFES
ncbi:MAG: hypothetical protein R6W91_04220 [Thermoplasmata archaeon]